MLKLQSIISTGCLINFVLFLHAKLILAVMVQQSTENSFQVIQDRTLTIKVYSLYTQRQNDYFYCYVQYTPPTRLNCRVESRLGCVHNSQLYSWRQSRWVWTNLPTAKSSCVVSAVRTHPSAVVTQFPVLLSYWGWWQVTTQWRHCWKSYQYRSKCT